jgi:hypothetical protein
MQGLSAVSGGSDAAAGGTAGFVLGMQGVSAIAGGSGAAAGPAAGPSAAAHIMQQQQQALLRLWVDRLQHQQAD